MNKMQKRWLCKWDKSKIALPVDEKKKRRKEEGKKIDKRCVIIVII